METFLQINVLHDTEIKAYFTVMMLPDFPQVRWLLAVNDL